MTYFIILLATVPSGSIQGTVPRFTTGKDTKAKPTQNASRFSLSVVAKAAKTMIDSRLPATVDHRFCFGSLWEGSLTYPLKVKEAYPPLLKWQGNKILILFPYSPLQFHQLQGF